MKMARHVIASSLLFSAPIGEARAASVCYKLNNYVDLFTTTTASGAPFLSDYAVYDAVHGYVLGLVGSSAQTVPFGAAQFIWFQGVNGSSSFFGGHTNCTFYFTRSEVSANFTMNATCNGGLSGIWKKTAAGHSLSNCTIPTPPPGAKALGEARSD